MNVLITLSRTRTDQTASHEGVQLPDGEKGRLGGLVGRGRKATGREGSVVRGTARLAELLP
jgi:hypothetical protein